MISQDLKKLQEYIWQKNIERGFSHESAERKMLMLTEEVGELAKAVRQHIGMGFSETTTKNEAAEELADVLIITMGLASTLNIDLFDALVQKESKNAKRTWSKATPR
jgi:NTP pyrophosphatase (non-canonical NTP hydrolase)